MSSFFDLATIVWGAIWAGIWAAIVAISVGRWKRSSAGMQYLLAALSLSAALIAPFMLFTWLAYTFYGTNGAIASIAVTQPLVWLIFRPMQNEEDEGGWFRRWEYKHLTVRLLWRDNRQRRCKRCGSYDPRTRYVTKPASEKYESAFAPCEKCGATDFDFFYLDGTPVKSP